MSKSVPQKKLVTTEDNLSYREASFYKHLSHIFFDQLWQSLLTSPHHAQFKKHYQSTSYQILAMVSPPDLHDARGEVHFTNLGPEECKIAIKNLFMLCFEISEREARKMTDDYFEQGLTKYRHQGFLSARDEIVPALPTNFDLQMSFFSAQEKLQNRQNELRFDSNLFKDPAREAKEKNKNDRTLNDLTSEFRIITEELFIADNGNLNEGIIRSKLAKNPLFKARSESDKDSIVGSVIDAMNDKDIPFNQKYDNALENYIGYVTSTSKGQYFDYYMLHHFEEKKQTIEPTVASTRQPETLAAKTTSAKTTPQKSGNKKGGKQQTQTTKKGSRKQEKDDDAALEEFLNNPEQIRQRQEAEKQERIAANFKESMSSLSQIYADKDGGTKEQFQEARNNIAKFLSETNSSNGNLLILLGELIKVAISPNDKAGRKKYFDDLVGIILSKLSEGKVTKEEMIKAFKNNKSSLIKTNGNLKMPEETISDFALTTFYRMMGAKYDKDTMAIFMSLFSMDADITKLFIGLNVRKIDTSSDFLRASIMAAITSPATMSLIIEQATKMNDKDISTIFMSESRSKAFNSLVIMAKVYDENPELFTSALELLKERNIKLSGDKEIISSLISITIKHAPEKIGDVLMLIQNPKQYKDSVNISRDFGKNNQQNLQYFIGIFSNPKISDEIKEEILLSLATSNHHNGLMFFCSDNSNYDVVKAILDYAINPDLFRQLIIKQTTDTSNNALHLAYANDPRIADLILQKVEEFDKGKMGPGSLMHEMLSQEVRGGEISVNALGFASISTNDDSYSRIEKLYQDHQIAAKKFPTNGLEFSIYHILLNQVDVSYDSLCQKITMINARDNMNLNPIEALGFISHAFSALINSEEIVATSKLGLIANFERILEGARTVGVDRRLLGEVEKFCKESKATLGYKSVDETPVANLHPSSASSVVGVARAASERGS